MSIEYIQTRPLPVAEHDVVDVARKIAQGLAPSVVASKTILGIGVHGLSDTPAIREEVEVLDEDGGAVYRLMPSRQRLRALGLKAGRGASYHLPHDREIVALRGPGSGTQGNIVGVLVYREGSKR